VLTDSNTNLDEKSLTPEEWNSLTQDLLELSVQIESFRKNEIKN